MVDDKVNAEDDIEAAYDDVEEADRQTSEDLGVRATGRPWSDTGGRAVSP